MKRAATTEAYADGAIIGYERALFGDLTADDAQALQCWIENQDPDSEEAAQSVRRQRNFAIRVCALLELAEAKLTLPTERT